MANAPSRTTATSRTRPARQAGGGPTAAGGYNFQAAVTAIALSHLARGSAIGWLDGIADDTPREVACETGGAGDDIRLTLAGGELVEIQVKKGLAAGESQREAMFRLAEALSQDRIGYGLLIVCPMSSRTIASTLADDLIQLGETPTAEVDTLAAEFRSRLLVAGIDIGGVCARLRIVTVAALRSNMAAVTAAKAELAHLCERQGEVTSAWNALYRDASVMVASRGTRRVGAVTATLRSAGIDLAAGAASGTAALIAKACAWTVAANDGFSILGVLRKLSIETAWQEQTLIVKATGADPQHEPAKALEDYHNWNRRSRDKGEATSAADALGRFHRHAVVVAGPGMGKSTLLRRLARRYAADGYPVLIVRARAVAAAMQSGSSFEAAVFELGRDGSALSAAQLRSAPIDAWVLLCDGLDEAGSSQDLVAEGLHNFQQGRPGARVLATTRPIGYRSHHLRDWRHYEIAGLGTDDAGRSLRRLLDHILPEPTDRQEDDHDFAERVAGDQAVRALIAQSPLMLGLAAAVLSRGGSLSGSRTGLFRSIFDLIQSEPSPRLPSATPAPEILSRALDVLGVRILDDPLTPYRAMVSAVGEVLADDLGVRRLQGLAVARECLAYWEALGVIETLRHEGGSILTTTHLLFAEYAAGRYLANLEPDDRVAAVRARAGQNRWTEGLAFAASEGAGDVVIEGLVSQGISGRSGRGRLSRCLDILATARTPLRLALADSLMEAAYAAMASDDIALACEITLSVVPLAKTRPTEIADLGARLLNAGHPWSQLAAWTLVTQAGTAYFDLEAAKGALLDVVDRQKDRPRLESGIVLNEPEAALLRLLAAEVFRAVLDRETLPMAEAFIEPLFKTAGLNNYLFWTAIRTSLLAHGSQVTPFSGMTWAGRMPDFNGWDAAAKLAYRKLIGSLVLPGSTLHPGERAPPGRSLFNLAAISHHCHWGRSSLGDVWAWKSTTETGGIEATFRGLISVSGLDPHMVSREALLMLQDLDSPNADLLSSVFGRFADIDIQEIDWSSIDRTVLDVEGLKLGLVHPSEQVAPVATALLDEVLTIDERRELVAAHMTSRRRLTVFAAVSLAQRLPLEEAIAALLAGLTPDSAGAEDRIRGLTTFGAPCSSEVFSVLRPILFSSDPEAAEVVAKFLHARLPLEPDVLEAVVEAETYWRTAEPPYPEEGGTVPSSPRSQLLDIIIRHDQLSLDDLLGWAGDKRHDVRNTALEGLKRLLQSSADVRADFAGRVGDGAVTAAVMSSIFPSDVRFDAADLDRLQASFSAKDSRVRLAAMAALSQPAFPEDRRTALLTVLRRDVEPVIRSRAARLLNSG